MAKAWTVKEELECSRIYALEGADIASVNLGRSKPSIYRRMQKLGVKSAHDRSDNLIARTRIWFADQIVEMFEMLESGLSSFLIAEYFNTTAAAIRSAISLAKNNGFDAYPLRNK